METTRKFKTPPALKGARRALRLAHEARNLPSERARALAALRSAKQDIDWYPAAPTAPNFSNARIDLIRSSIDAAITELEGTTT